jgi:hypothetical protein
MSKKQEQDCISALIYTGPGVSVAKSIRNKLIITCSKEYLRELVGRKEEQNKDSEYLV